MLRTPISLPSLKPPPGNGLATHAFPSHSSSSKVILSNDFSVIRVCSTSTVCGLQGQRIEHTQVGLHLAARSFASGSLKTLKRASRAAMVLGPTLPSSTSGLFARWNALTAWTVSAP